MSWNYRVTRTTDPNGEGVFSIREVYYAPDGRVTAWSENAVCPQGETFGELTKDVENYGRAFQKPVIDIRADGLYEIGCMGNSRKPVKVWASPPAVDAVGEASESPIASTREKGSDA